MVTEPLKEESVFLLGGRVEPVQARAQLVQENENAAPIAPDEVRNGGGITRFPWQVASYPPHYCPPNGGQKLGRLCPRVGEVAGSK